MITFKKRYIILFTIIGIVLLSPYLLNRYRISTYDDHMKHSRSFKTHCYLFPDQIPKSASSVYYKRGTLRFKLPEEEAFLLRAKILNSRYMSGEDLARPSIIDPSYEELSWSSSMLNHGTTDGAWYNPKEHEFIFYHDHW